VVTDFGLARRDADDSAAPRGDRATEVFVTQIGSVIGTPAFMSPEQLRGAPVDARSDQFSFCVALWTALFGAPPFAYPPSATLDELRRASERGVAAPTPPVPAALVPVERALRRGLSHDPHDRFPDMSSLLDALLAPARTRRRAYRYRFAAITAL